MTSDDVLPADDGEPTVTHAMPAGGTPVGPQVPDDLLPDAGMDTGSDEGSPGEREPVDPEDPVAVAVQDDAPLPPEVGGPRAGAPDQPDGGPSGDGLDPAFTHP